MFIRLIMSLGCNIVNCILIGLFASINELIIIKFCKEIICNQIGIIETKCYKKLGNVPILVY